MAGLPKKYARMGFKRGWAMYNKSHKVKRTKKRSVYTMAKRTKKHYFKKVKHYAKSKGIGFGSVGKVLIGAALAALYEVYVSPMIPLDGMIKNIVELGAGIFLASMKGMPMPVRAFGSALAIINAYSLIVPYISGAGTSGSSGSAWD